MKHEQTRSKFLQLEAFFLALTLSVTFIAGLIKPITAQAEQSEEIYYCDDVAYYDDNHEYHGEGGQVSAFYEVACDSYEISANYGYPSMPSFGSGAFSNACAIMAGTNILVFYDRWLTDLVPNYTPGMMNTGTDGVSYYAYFPNNNTAPISTLMTTLYQLMGTTAENGTTANQFRSGMQSYVNGQGYSISYESCYQNSTMVNLTKIRQAVENNKVALIMCSTYNFVYSINESINGIAVNKVDGNRGHMMFVYGYCVYNYYNNGVNFRTDTFLYVSSGYQAGYQGYILLNDHLTIEEAYVVTIS